MVFFSKSIISDEDLVARLRQGDEKAFTAIYERYHKLLYVPRMALPQEPGGGRGCCATDLPEALGVAFRLDGQCEFEELSLYDDQELGAE